jgi:aspartyl-tRNA(Asn)/glutamyl-tRNA(Gln) amidotransferase subunit C
MGKLDHDDVLKLAKLAKLALRDEEVKQFQAEINEILGYVDMLQKVDVGGLEPTYQVTGLTNVTRPDEITDYGYTTEALRKNLPATEKRYIKVKRVLN